MTLSILTVVAQLELRFVQTTVSTHLPYRERSEQTLLTDAFVEINLVDVL